MVKIALLTAAGLLALAGSAPAQILFSENFEGGGLGVYTETLGGVPAATQWHGEGFCTPGVPIPATMGTNAASYNQGDIGTYNFNTPGSANSGELESPAIGIPVTGFADIAFEYTKETEGGGTGSFDQCFVEVASGGGGYSVAGQITGNSVCASTAVTVGPAAVAGASWTHRFRFNTVDSIGNAFQGWTVDNVVASVAPAPPTYCVTPAAAVFSTISTSPTATLVFGPGVDDVVSAAFALPAPFSLFGVPKATFQVDSNGFITFDQALLTSYLVNAAIPAAALPNDAVFGWWDDLHTGAVGNVYYDTTVSGQLIVEWNSMEQFPGNASGENATFQIRLNPSPANTIELIYDGATFTSGGGPAPTLWHGEGFCSPGVPIPLTMGTNSAAYNQGDLGTYNFATGVTANSGGLESPSIPAAGTLPVVLSFEYTKETEGGGTATFDQCFVESRDGAGAYFTDTQIVGNSPCPASTVVAVPLSAGALAWQHRFRFNSVDGVSNTYQGWYVDNVSAVDSAAATLFTEDFESVAPPGLASYTEVSGATITWSASIGIENASGSNGVDATGLGTGNAAFPGTNLLLVPHTAGSFGSVPTGCGALTITPSGSPSLGATVTITLGGVTGFPLMWIGAPVAPVPLCPPAPCSIGASLTVVLPVSSFSATIPCDPALIGSVVAVQGGDALGAGGCGAVPFGVPFTISNTVLVTIG